jgi:hypothetical protein
MLDRIVWNESFKVAAPANALFAQEQTQWFRK